MRVSPFAISAVLAAALATSACQRGGDVAEGADAAQTAAAGEQAVASGQTTPGGGVSPAGSPAAGDVASGAADAHTNTSTVSGASAGGGPQGQTPAYGQPGGAPTAVTEQNKGQPASVGNDTRPGI